MATFPQKMNIVLSGSEYDNDDLLEDKINTLIDGKKLAKNASYFAFYRHAQK